MSGLTLDIESLGCTRFYSEAMTVVVFCAYFFHDVSSVKAKEFWNNKLVIHYLTEAISFQDAHIIPTENTFIPLRTHFMGNYTA